MKRSFLYFRYSLIVVMLCTMSKVSHAQNATEVAYSVIQLPQELKLEDQVYEDINQDGLKDLALATSHRDRRYVRSVRIHFQQNSKPRFKNEPDHIVSLTSDVIAYACVDTDPHPGAEILLFTANACFGYRIQEESRDRIYKIAACDFLWQLPDPHHVFSWQGAVLDFNSDGRVDLLLPRADGFRVLLQGETGFMPTSLLEVPRDKHVNRSNVRMDRDQSGGRLTVGFEGVGSFLGIDKRPQSLVSVHHDLSVPLFTDWNGDRRYDILTQTSSHMYLWQQGTQETFAHAPLEIPLPVDDRQDTGMIVIATKQYVLDLNRDSCCDFILFTRDRHSKKRLFTQVLVFINPNDAQSQNALFGDQGIPQQLLKIAGEPGKAQLADINGDGYPDLSFVTFRPDLLDQVKTLAAKAVKLQFLAFINHRGRFSPRPDLIQDVYVSVGEQENSNFDQGRFLVDFNKDGLLDVLVRDTKTHIGLRLLRKTKKGMQISKADMWDTTIPEKARLLYEHTQTPSEPVLLITSPDQIIHVRFP
jgi:hypothetical protein